MAGRSYADYASVFLAVTLLAGVWLRLAMLSPPALGPLAFRNLVHAHSHLAFFGWVTMALFSVIAASSSPRAPAWTRWHAHAVGAASVLAFAGFLHQGYAPFTYAVSAGHVVLWGVFACRAWPALGRAPAPGRHFFRVALAFLAAAGVGTVGTGVLTARATDPWTARFAVELFLTPFTAGWLGIGAYGVAYRRLPRARFSTLVLVLSALGSLPSGFLHIAAAPPAPWLMHVGRAGTALVCIASLAFAADVLRHREVPPFLHLAGAAALTKGAAEALLALGPAAQLVASQPLTIAYLHLVLLGVVTPVLADGLFAPGSRAAAGHTLGIALQLAPLAVLGWPPLFSRAAQVGVGPEHLLAIALAGGVVSATTLVAVCFAGSRRGSRTDPLPPR